MKTALITGVTGQDGSYLADLLLGKGYRVVGMVRRSSSFNTKRIDHLIDVQPNFIGERADLQDSTSVFNVLTKHKPSEIYHLAAQSHVGVSFDIPEYTVEVGVLGTLRMLEAIRNVGLDCSFYNAGSSEMFGSTPAPQNEKSPFSPQSPYAVAKVAAHHLVRLYRDAYNLRAFNGILFNHESPRRGETFVTRKVTRAIAKMVLGTQSVLELGNLDAKRDWGFAGDYVEAMWKMLQTSIPDDYVIATGTSISVREFVSEAFKHVGVNVVWQGEGLEEVATVGSIEMPVSSLGDVTVNHIEIGSVVVRVSERYFRPAEVDSLEGDFSKSAQLLQWKPTKMISEIAAEMVNSDLAEEHRRIHGDGGSN